MATLPRISVALCVHNGARWLPLQLESVLAQEGVALEVVALDDASTDGSLDLLHGYAARDPRVRVFSNEHNLGHLQSFERCMSLCVSELIAPCDQDDVWDVRKLALLAESLGDADLAYCDSEYIDSDGRPMGRRLSDDRVEMHAGRDALRYVFENTVSGHALLVRRDVFERARPFPQLLFHDWWLALQAASGAGVVYLDRPLVKFRRHAAASSSMGKSGKSGGASKQAHAEGDDDAPRKVKRHRSRNRRWVEQLMYVFDAMATSHAPLRHVALAWHLALRDALNGRWSPLWRVVWRSRGSLPPWKGPRWWTAVAFYMRCVRKVIAARREASLGPALFR